MQAWLLALGMGRGDGHPAAAGGSTGCARSQDVQGQTPWPLGGGQGLGAGLGSNLWFFGVISVAGRSDCASI